MLLFCSVEKTVKLRQYPNSANLKEDLKQLDLVLQGMVQDATQNVSQVSIVTSATNQRTGSLYAKVPELELQGTGPLTGAGPVYFHAENILFDGS